MHSLKGELLEAARDVSSFLQKGRTALDSISDESLATGGKNGMSGAFILSALKDAESGTAVKTIIRMENANSTLVSAVKMASSIIRTIACSMGMELDEAVSLVVQDIHGGEESDALRDFEMSPILFGYTFESSGDVELKGSWGNVEYEGHTWLPDRKLAGHLVLYVCPSVPGACLLVSQGTGKDGTAIASKYIPSYEV